MTATPNQPHIGLVVEGRGEREALPCMLRKYLGEELACFKDILGKSIPCNGRDKALMAGGIEGKIAAAGYRPGCKGVMVVLDAEGDAICSLGPEIKRRAARILGLPVQVCLADPMYEAWLVASAETLGLGGLTFSAGNPTALIERALFPDKYIKPIWQPRLTQRMDLTLARGRSPSLDRMLSKFASLATPLV